MSKFEPDDEEYLVDLLFETNKSLAEISRELDIPINDVKRKIDQLGLSWIKDSKKKTSRGQAALTLIMQKILVGEKIVNEYPISDKMRLDIYCPKYKIAAEYHGRQHFFYTGKFFDSKYEFEEAQKRDQKKVEYCKENGIALIVFRYNDLLSEDVVYDRMLEAIRQTGYMPAKSNARKAVNNPFYQSVKKKNSEYRKQLYRKIKDYKSNGSR